MLGRGYYSEYALSSISIYITFIAIELRGYNAAFCFLSLFVDFYLFYDGACKYEPFWQELNVESLILKPLRPIGLLFNILPVGMKNE